MTPRLVTTDAGVETVPFVIKLEPLYFGVLPATVLPILAFLVVAVLGVWRWGLPRVMNGLLRSALDVRKEVVIRRNSIGRR